MVKEHWIKKVVSQHHGQLHKDLGVPIGKPIPYLKLLKASKGSGKVAERARLAVTLRKMVK